jgi:hypothetical protein
MQNINTKNTTTQADFQDYFDKGIRVIPIGLTAKGQGKMPLINNWQSLPWDEMGDPYDIISNWFELYGDRITGMGIPLGQNNNRGLCCLDADTNDPEIIERLKKYFNCKISKIGGKGFSAFFISDGKHEKNYYKFDCPGNLGIIEIFYGGKQIVIPPSYHSENKVYRWEDSFCTLLTVDYDDLPILPIKYVEGIGQLIGSPTVSIANQNLPKSYQFKDGQNRTIAINSLIGKIFKHNPHPDPYEVGNELLTYDAIHFPDNSFFLDPRKSHNKTSDRSTNCLSYMASMNSSFYSKSGQGIVFDSPVETQTITFARLVPVNGEEKVKEEEGVPEFDKSLIPECWRSMIEHISDGQGMPAHVIFMAQMTALGASLQGNTVIKPLKEEHFFRRTNLAVAIVAESGSKKSDVIRNAVYECKKINKQLKKINSRDDLQRIQDLEMRLEGLSKSKKDLSRKGDDVTQINEEIRKLQDQLDEKPLQGTDWMYENATIQQMILDSMKNQKTGLFVIKDEMKQLMADFKKKGNEDARTFYMKGIDGNDSFTYKTISRGDNTVEQLFISLLTNVQPDVLSMYINQLYNAYGENDGFFQRITYVPYGTPIAVKAKPVDFKRFTVQYEHFNRAFYSPMVEVHIEEGSVEHYLELRHIIQLNAIKFHGTPVTSVLAKFEGLLCVYAYLYEFLENPGKPKVITRKSLDKAMALLTWLGECAKYLFQIKDKQADHDAANTVASMLVNRHFKSGVTQSEIHQNLRGVFKYPQTFYKALKDLELRGYIKLVNERGNSVIVHINPMVYTL